MATKYRWFFDGVQVTEPTNALEMQETIQYDEKLKFIYWEKSNSFQFVGDAYDYLFTQYTNGFCNEVAVHIDEDCDLNGSFAPIFDGIIKIRDVKFDFIKCECSTTVNDNNYFAYINNNASLPYLISVGKSKFNEIIEIPYLFNVDIVAISGQTFQRQLYKIGDVFAALIAHITDDKIDYESSYFGVGGEKEFLMIGTGYQMRVNGWSSVLPELGLKIDYKTLFDEACKKFNLISYIDYSGTKPKIKIERKTNFFSDENSIIISDPHQLKLSTLVDNLFARVSVGGTTFPQTAASDFPSEINYYGFKKEDIQLTYSCNIDKSLDLQGAFIADTNIITDSLNGGDTWNENIFLLDCYDNSGTVTAKRDDIFDNGKLYYNEDLTNKNILLRWESELPTSLSIYSSNTSVTFDAKRISDLPQTAGSIYPVGFETDYSYGGYDPNNVFGNGTPQGFPITAANSRFTAVNDGQHYMVFICTFQGAPANYHEANLKVYNSSGGLKATYTDSFTSSGNPGFTQKIFKFYPNMNIGDYCDVELINTYAMSRIFYSTPIATFRLVQSPTQSGISQIVETDNSKTLLIDFNCNLNKTEYYNMKTGFKKYIEVHSKTKIFRGYLYASKYDETSGNAEITLITSNNFIDGRNS